MDMDDRNFTQSLPWALAAALVLLAGQVLGSCGPGHPDPGILGCAGLVAGLLGLAAGARPRAAGIGLVLGLLLLSAARTAAAEVEVQRLEGRGGEVEQAARRGWIEGTWVPRGRADSGVGLLDLGPGRTLPWLLRCAGAAPEPGERVALWADGEARAYAQARGVRPDDGLRGEWRVHPDELRRLGTCASPLGRALRGARRPLEDALGELRAFLRTRLQRADAVAQGLGPALLWGERRDLERDLQDLFTRTGTRHLLALSGLHVGLLAVLMLLPARRALAAALARVPGVGRRAEAAATCAALASLGVFVALTGGAAPVLRAGLALSLVLLSAHLPAGPASLPGIGRRARALPLIGLALLFEAVGDARAFADLSVQLSYGATLAILLVALPAARRLAPLAMGHDGPALELAWMRGRGAVLWTVLRLRTVRFAATGLGASAAAQLSTLPTSVATFGEFAPLGGLLTLGATPLVALLLPALALAVALPFPLAGAPARGLADLLLAWLKFGDRLPATPWLAPERPTALVALACALGLHALHRGFGWSARGALLLGAALLLPWRPAPTGLTLDLIDGGHGTACVLELPGGDLWLFDGGTRDTPGLLSRAYRPLLRARDPGRVHLVLSHLDRDHWSVLPWLGRRLHVVEAFGQLPPELELALDASVRRSRGPIGPGATDLLTPEHPVRLRLVGGGGASDNEGSTTLLVSFAGRELVLSGDAVAAGLARLIEDRRLPAAPDLLLMPHHGSFGDAIGSLLDGLAPARIWIAAGSSAPIEPELRRRGLPYWCTPLDGPLRLELRPSGTAIWSAGPERLPETGGNPALAGS